MASKLDFECRVLFKQLHNLVQLIFRLFENLPTSSFKEHVVQDYALAALDGMQRYVHDNRLPVFIFVILTLPHLALRMHQVAVGTDVEGIDAVGRQADNVLPTLCIARSIGHHTSFPYIDNLNVCRHLLPCLGVGHGTLEAYCHRRTYLHGQFKAVKVHLAVAALAVGGIDGGAAVGADNKVVVIAFGIDWIAEVLRCAPGTAVTLPVRDKEVEAAHPFRTIA